jgi:biotin synthase
MEGELQMKFDASLLEILGKALEGHPPGKRECVQLLSFPEGSMEAGILMAAADHISRRRFGNHAIVLAQIGIETRPCPGRCAFCAFGEGHAIFERSELSLGEIIQRALDFSGQGDLYALFLMTMHDFDFQRLLAITSAVRRAVPDRTRIVVNTGDLEGNQGNELRSAGVDGAYHVCRLREGVDTALESVKRRRTLEIIRKTGLDLYYCCDPIGPEHTPDELAEQIFIGIDYGCAQHAAMRRVHVPGTPLSQRGQITEHRLAQIAAVVALATLGCKETKSIAVHEPNLLGLCAGANAIYAETGSNPRDTAADTSGHRGLDVGDCRKMLWEAGFK